MVNLNAYFLKANTRAGFEKALAQGRISEEQIAFIIDTQEIWTQNKFFPCPYTKEEIDSLIRTGVSIATYSKEESDDKYLQLNDASKVATSGSYTDLINTPDLSRFITNSVSDLVNYYLKSEVYNKEEIGRLLTGLTKFTYRVVDKLPTPGQDTLDIIFLVDSTNPDTQNVKDEFLTVPVIYTVAGEEYTSYKWEQIGSTAADLGGYATEQWVENKNYLTQQDISNKQDVITDIDDIRANANREFSYDNKYEMLYFGRIDSVFVDGMNVYTVNDSYFGIEAEGFNLNSDTQFYWTLTFDQERVSLESIGPVLVLSTVNTEKYANSSKITATIATDSYSSQVFTLKDATERKRST